MPDFPKPEKIVEDLNVCRSYIDVNEKYPRRGEVAAADYLIDFVQKWSLGNVRRVLFPQHAHQFKKFITQEPEIGNVVIEAGDGNDELLILHGHFDVVPPSDDMSGLTHDQNKNNIVKGRGAHDMLSGIAAFLTSLRNMKIAPHRRVRAILVCGEENESEGTHAAFHPSNNLFEFNGKKAAISTEIVVASSIYDPYQLVVGRPGRYAVDLKINGLEKHTGTARGPHFIDLTCNRVYRAIESIYHLSLNPHPRDSRGLLFSGPGQCCPEGGEIAKAGGISTIPWERRDITIHYADPNQTLADIQVILNEAIQKALGDTNYELKVPPRDLPWTVPWLEDLDDPMGNPFPYHIQRFADDVTALKRTSEHVPFIAGKGVADENIIASHNIPVICIPPRGEGEHSKYECVDMRGVTEYQEPVIRKAAAFNGMLTQ